MSNWDGFNKSAGAHSLVCVPRITGWKKKFGKIYETGMDGTTHFFCRPDIYPSQISSDFSLL